MLMYFLILIKDAKSKPGHFYKLNGNESMVSMITTIGCREGSDQVKQHPTGFIGSADYIIFSTEPGV